MGRQDAGRETPSTTDLVDRLRRRDRRALAQVITRIENGDNAVSLSAVATEPGSQTPILGITGSTGVGKSTLVAALIERYRAAGKTIAVLACDPQSPLSGGSLLGDRIRARFAPDDEGVYFRSLSTRGAPGGLSQAAQPVAQLLARCGFSLVVVETVGVGQEEMAVRDVADVVALLIAPGAGDEVQWQKAGLIEVADLIVVNKADLPGADVLATELSETLGAGNGNAPEVIQVSSTALTGVDLLIASVERLANRLPTFRGRLAKQRRSQRAET